MATRLAGRFEIGFGPDDGDLEIDGMSAYVRVAHLEDGSVWVPSRTALEQSQLMNSIPVSAEEQRLSQMYRERGPDAVLEELRKLRPAGDVAP